MAAASFVVLNFIFLSLVSLSILTSHMGRAQFVPVQQVASVFSCFNSKIYSGCNEEYRLTRSGNINVPPEATDMFCFGPCLDETKHVLNCITGILSGFQFYNGAYVKDVGYALNAGCSNSIQRGNFDVGSYMEGETSSASSTTHLFGVGFITWCCLMLIQSLLGPL